MKVVELPAATKDVGETLSDQLSHDRLDRSQHFLKLLSSARFLHARPGLPFRGHDDSNSHFVQLIHLRAEDDERLASRIQKKTDKFTSPVIQIEIIDVMALKGVTQHCL